MVHSWIFPGWLVAMLGTAVAAHAADPAVTLTRLRGNVYVVEDTFYSRENSAVYIGQDHVTVIGATWTPETARLLAEAIAKVTPKPVIEVIDTNYHPDRAGGNAYFKNCGARILSTEQTRDLMRTNWDHVVRLTRQSNPGYPELPAVLPDEVFPGDFALQGGRVKALYFGPSHTPDGIFVFFPEEKILYGGCILKEQLGSLAFANLEEYPKTLRKLQQANLGYTTIIAGHYSPMHGPELVGQYLGLLQSAQGNR
ncbi:MAG: subclass B2 metallo-beta-lactamase [Verrucomicrobiota bacterium]